MALSGNSAAFAYAWSLAVVESIVQSGGITDISRLLDRIATSSSTEAALRETLRCDYADLAAANRRLPPPRLRPLIRIRAEVIPVSSQDRRNRIGFMSGSIGILGDIVSLIVSRGADRVAKTARQPRKE